MRNEIVLAIVIVLLIIGTSTFAFDIQPVKAEPTTWIVDDDGPADFHTIQEAIDAADTGDTVYVKAGTYFEHIVLSESLTLKGENATSTVIDGSNGLGYTVDVEADNVTIEGFTIRNGTGLAMWFWSPDNCKIIGNTIVGNKYGIYLSGGQGNSLYRNTITSNEENGVSIVNSENNIITENTISDNKRIGIYVANPGNGIIYHNNFINNGQNAFSYSANIWDDGYPSGGNYWSNYTGADLYSGPDQDYPSGGDGLGDSSFAIDENNHDRYPLMKPWIERSVGVEVGDWVQYGNFEVAWSSEDPTGNPPFDYDFWTGIQWTQTAVQSISGTTVTFEFMIHFKNGTEQSSIYDIDVVTGEGFPFYFISAWLSAGYATYAGGVGYWPGPKINETISRAYLGALRETNHFGVTRFYEDYFGRKNFRESYDVFWDRNTGVQTEYSYQQSFETGTEAYLTTLLTSFRIVDTNLWKNPWPCDINCDQKVDVRDIAMAALAFGSNVGYSRWDPRADINGDGIIDIRDLVIIAKNFGTIHQ